MHDQINYNVALKVQKKECALKMKNKIQIWERIVVTEGEIQIFLLLAYCTQKNWQNLLSDKN